MATNNWKRRSVLRGLGGLAAAAPAAATPPDAMAAPASDDAIARDAVAAAGRPHLVVIIIDDLARRELGCYGNTFNETPNIDRLAVDGVRFTHAYAAAPVCSPTRGSRQPSCLEPRNHRATGLARLALRCKIILRVAH
ncbi:sulfatase-like hydrolase/transferase [Couchioplanes caeruleus]|uniref:Sulfatase N-terminal domain-containing protein n=2 Tax=Couchioplanes caeruleus TaxID=56438 RepID=A0A1K0FNB3_9ACTN|nr:sulfatase-like hydrolase/transferase [Couchioplanes caeruleus]OJF14281.1 hypothetical protein BG844_10645 [Couchioplanes caeruleus subsp. caeruleus]ROP31600.1 sulfatase-like protein [Couchioplanes caeruleus]